MNISQNENKSDRSSKVYIIRESRGFTEVDGAIDLLKLDMDPHPLERPGEPIVVISDDDEEPANDVDSESQMDIRFSEHVLLFQDVKTFKDFEVHVDGLVLDSEMPTHVREKYYELCRSQNRFLHENVTGGFNINLVVGMISETVNITDAIRRVKSTTHVSHIKIWDKTLKAFEKLGMTVGFLRARVHRLLNLYLESKAALETKKRERDEAENEMKCLKGKLRRVRAKLNELDALVAKYQDHDSVLKEIAGAPW